ncbi:MAG TPA: GatB/YqeY domain-containing protein [Candidatus Omnitrophota bacterium]|nr:GatB/YqeY domain-containing protein [Candidatus Omnitrophota bacterium]HQL41774.1 GatB/YqeY domain-containing protein [Candidatus Omnitrophota bacterium]
MLEQRISADYIQAMKDKDSVKSATLSFLRAQIKNVRIDKRVEKVDDLDIIAVIKKQIKQRQESIAQFEQGGRVDLADKEKAEMVILQNYLPQQASAQEIADAVGQAVHETGAKSMKDMGSVMKAVVAKFEGRADNKIISDLVRQALSSL